MLRETDVFDAQGFSFAEFGEQKTPTLVTVERGADGAAATIADAHLLFNSDFSRSGNDLRIDGHNGERAIVHDYFGTGERAALMSAEGARLSPDLVEALTKSVAPHQYAQATPPAPAASDAVGRVVTASPDSTILRNGVPVTIAVGDPVLRADVLQTAGGTMAVTFNDGSTLNLTANTRIVVSEFIYSPSNTGNSQLLDLIQGSLTFISGEVAHTGDMRIGTPVATMGIRGTVGGVTTASDGTVQFYVSQSATGAVIINQQGQIIANVVQDGPLIVVRPVGPLQVIADEIQKSPAQLAAELQALQQIVNIKAVGDQLLQQFFQQQQQQNPNPQSPQNGPHTQIQVDDKLKITLFLGDKGDGNGVAPATRAVIETLIKGPDAPPNVTVPILVNLPPVTFAPLSLTTAEDTPLVFSGPRSISVVDGDSQTMTVTLSVTNGVLSLGNVAGLSFSAGDGASDGTMTFSGTPAAIAAALNGLTYTPSQDYNGPATLSISAGDGNSAPLTTTVTLDVTAVNDAPVVGSTATAPVAYTENDGATVVNATLMISDVDSATLSGATVKIAANFAVGEDVLGFTSQGGITGSYDAQTGILTLAGVASLADYQAVLRSVTYTNTSGNPSNAPRTIEFQVDDGSSEHSTSNVISAVVNVSPANDAPVLTLGGHVADQFDSQAFDLNSGTANWTTDWVEDENGDYASSPTTGEIQIRTDPSVSDTGFRLFLSDDDSEAGAADTIQRSADLSGASSATLTFDYRRQINSGDLADVVKIWASTDGINFTQIGQIGATGSGTFIDQTYQHFSVDLTGYISPTTTVRFSIDDGADDTDWFYIDNVKIDYSANPTYVEGGSAVSIAPVGASIKDADNTTLQSATITLTNAQAGDLLSVNGQLPAGILASSYDTQTGVLTLSGSATLADYQAALAQIQFSNTGDNPGSSDRTIQVVVSDGSANSNTGTVTVHVTPVNDAPQSTDSANPGTFTEDTDTVIPFSALLANASDPEGDTLSIVNIATSSANGGTVTVNGTDITYHPAANFTGFDYFLYSITDGQATITRAATFTVAAVNDAPVATITPTSYNATEQTALTLKGSGLSISDVDAASGSMTATLSVTNGVLNATAGDSGASVSNSGTSSLTITGTVAQINALLATGGTSTLSYINNSDAPPASATLSLQVADNGNTGGGNLTASDTATISIAGVNDAPLASDTANPGTFTEDTDTVIAASTLLANASDPDGDTLTVTGVGSNSASGGTVTLSGTNITYHPAANFSGFDYFIYTVSDGQTSIYRAATFTVAAVNDAPAVNANGASLSYSEDQAAAAIASSIAVTDVDNTSLTGATVQITGNFAASEDVLGITNQNGISGSYNSATGILALTGAATLAQYQAALASVTYSNAHALSTATRTVSFTVTDGQASSNIATVDVAVAAVNDTLNLSAVAWAAAGTINPGGGANVVNVAADGDISASGMPTVSNVTTGNLTGTGSDDSVTLTGLQLDGILIGSGTIDLGAGTGDTINLKTTSDDLNTLGTTDASITGVEAISAAGAGAAVAVNLSGQSEAFTVTGSNDADTLTGGTAADTISGGDGNDTITGGAGADTLNGGAGADVFVMTAPGNLTGDIIDGIHDNANDDTIRLDGAGTYDFATATVSNIDSVNIAVNAAGFNIVLTDDMASTAAYKGTNTAIEGRIRVNATVAVSNDVTIDASDLQAGQRLFVNASNLNGNDTITGGAGTDNINGGAGNDTITGGAGNDDLTGGTGADTFVFHTGFGIDTVSGFDETLDYLQFDQGIFANVAALLAATTDSGANTVIEYDSSNKVTLEGVQKADLLAHTDHILIV